MPRSKRVAKLRQQDLGELLTPSLLTFLASDFQIWPLRDSADHGTCCHLYFFGRREKLPAMQAEFAEEIEAERQQLAAEGWPPISTTPPWKSELQDWESGRFESYSTTNLWQAYATVRDAYDLPTWPADRLEAIKERLRGELERRRGAAD